MNREEFARKIRWGKIMIVMGILNVLALLPQLAQIWVTRETAGISLVMFSIFITVQTGFALEGFFSRNLRLMIPMVASGIVSIAIISSVLYLR